MFSYSALISRLRHRGRIQYAQALYRLRVAPTPATAESVLRFYHADRWLYGSLTDRDTDRLRALRYSKDEEGDDSRELADFYAYAFNLLTQAGQKPDEEEIERANEELEGSGYALHLDGGKWHVVADAKPERFGRDGAPLRYEVRHCPPGGVTIGGKAFRGGQFIPAADYEKATPAVKEKIDAESDTRKAGKSKRAGERRARGSVDTDKFRERLAPHGHHDVNEQRAAASFRALHRHHGELVVHRLEELADGLLSALDRIPEDETGIRENLGKQLRQIEHQLGLAKDKGHEGKVEKPPAADLRGIKGTVLGHLARAGKGGMTLDALRSALGDKGQHAEMVIGELKDADRIEVADGKVKMKGGKQAAPKPMPERTTKKAEEKPAEAEKGKDEAEKPKISPADFPKEGTQEYTDGDKIYEVKFFPDGAVNTALKKKNGFVISRGASTVERLAKQFNEQGFSKVGVKQKKVERGTKRGLAGDSRAIGDSLYRIVLSKKGLNLELTRKLYNIKTDFLESAIGGGIFRKDGIDIDLMAEEMEAEGHIITPKDRHVTDWLLEKLQQKALSLHADLDKEYEKSSNAYYKEQEDARNAGADPGSIGESAESGRADGVSEAAKRGHGESLEQLADADPDEAGGIGDEGVGDVGDFDFGANEDTSTEPVTEDTSEELATAKPAEPSAPKAKDATPKTPWQMTNAEYDAAHQAKYKAKPHRSMHQGAVIDALNAGEAVPESIVGEHMDLFAMLPGLANKYPGLKKRAIATGVLREADSEAKAEGEPEKSPAETPKSGAAGEEKGLVRHAIDVDKKSMFASGQKRSQYATTHQQISVKALEGANAVWHHQGDPQHVIWDSAGKDASEYSKKKASEIEAAKAAGYKFTNHKAGKYGTLWVLEKDGRVLTERGADALVKGTGQVDLPSGTTRETAKPVIESVNSFVKSLPESTRSNFGTLVTAINRSPLGKHVSLLRDEYGNIRLSSKGGNWHIFEPSSGHDAQGNWHGQLESSLPRMLAKLDHMAANDIPTDEGGWAVHDRASDAHAVSSVPPSKFSRNGTPARYSYAAAVRAATRPASYLSLVQALRERSGTTGGQP